MSERTQIEWCDATWNPTRGCSPVSEGCRRCYAAQVAARFSDPGQPYAGLARRAPGGGRWTGEVRLVPEALALPLRWRRPRRIFVNSMSDLFHERLTDEIIAAIFGVMAAARRHLFIVLTKRPERMRRWCGWVKQEAGTRRLGLLLQHAQRECSHRDLRDTPLLVASPWPLPNVILGVSVEDQATADERIPLLLRTPAACRAVSYEPALGPIDLRRVLWSDVKGLRVDVLRGGFWDDNQRSFTRGFVNCSDFPATLGWIIVGGESGPGARPFDLSWARSTISECRAASVPCFVKQLGAKPWAWSCANGPTCTHPDCGRVSVALRNARGGDPHEWPENLRVREWPETAR